MIRVTRLNGQPIVLNSDLIKFVERAPDTVITLTNGEKLIVRESEDEVVRLVLEFRRSLMANSDGPRTQFTLNPKKLSPSPEGQIRG